MKHALLFTLLVFASPASAFPIIGGTGQPVPHTDKTVGWTFEVLRSFELSGIGWGYDVEQHRSEDHRVGIWKHTDGGYELIVEDIVPAGVPYYGEIPTFNPSIIIGPGLYTAGGVDHPDEVLDLRLITGDFLNDIFPASYNAFPTYFEVGQAVISEQPGFHVPPFPIQMQRVCCRGQISLAYPSHPASVCFWRAPCSRTPRCGHAATMRIARFRATCAACR